MDSGDRSKRAASMLGLLALWELEECELKLDLHFALYRMYRVRSRNPGVFHILQGNPCSSSHQESPPTGMRTFQRMHRQGLTEDLASALELLRLQSPKWSQSDHIDTTC